MAWQIVCLAGPSDTFIPPSDPGDHILRIPFDAPGDPDAPQERLERVFDAAGVRLGRAATDLLRAAIGAYAGDVRAPRQGGYDAWSRDLVLHLPVADRRWDHAGPIFERLLRFLTGDHWRVVARLLREGYRSAWDDGRQSPPDPARSAALFSGGLDSFIGAIDTLGRGDTPLLIGHHAAGQGATSVSQDTTIARLRDRFGADRVRHVSCWVSIPRGRAATTEATTRGRSILFLALGAAVASGTGATRLLVPENGLISLNVPLTPARGGSLSTRTTHPHLIALYRQLLAALGIPLAIELPYRFATKGEMLRDCVDQPFVAATLADTMSCAHPSAGRFTRGGSGRQHCGYCFPCLIRRAATDAWGVDPTTYAFAPRDDALTRTRRADLRALRLALARYERQPPAIADLLRAGPLPGTAAEQHQYLDVFRRGMGELGTFVSANAGEADDAPG